MSKSPVQQWVDNIPPSQLVHRESIYDPNTKSARKFLFRDRSFQSDDGSSHCSSLESFLEMRRPDPEEMLLDLGFGPKPGSEGVSRIPARFLKPSKVSTSVYLEIIICVNRKLCNGLLIKHVWVFQLYFLKCWKPWLRPNQINLVYLNDLFINCDWTICVTLLMISESYDIN